MNSTISYNIMKRIPIGIFLLCILTSFKADLSGPWIRTVSEKIVLFTRPNNHSATLSPDSIEIRKIIEEQEQVIELINNRLNLHFDSKVEIYLYNFDEAKDKIGTNGGGFCSSKNLRIYFTFYEEPIFNTIRNTFEYIGVHEMVHLVANHELDKSKTRFFGEGYANAIDGNYGAIKLEDQLQRRRNDSTIQRIIKSGKLLTPTELLHGDLIKEGEYYPQIGCFFSWLFMEYGVEKINNLYTLNRKKVEQGFLEETGIEFIVMEKKYLDYLNSK